MGASVTVSVRVVLGSEKNTTPCEEFFNILMRILVRAPSGLCRTVLSPELWCYSAPTPSTVHPDMSLGDDVVHLHHDVSFPQPSQPHFLTGLVI